MGITMVVNLRNLGYGAWKTETLYIYIYMCVCVYPLVTVDLHFQVNILGGITSVYRTTSLVGQ